MSSEIPGIPGIPASTPTTPIKKGTATDKKEGDDVAEWLRKHGSEAGLSSREISTHLSRATQSGALSRTTLSEKAVESNALALRLTKESYAALAEATARISSELMVPIDNDDNDDNDEEPTSRSITVRTASAGASDALNGDVEQSLANDRVTDVLVLRILKAYKLKNPNAEARNIAKGLSSIINEWNLSQREAAVVMIELAKIDNSGRLTTIKMSNLAKYIKDNQYDVQLISSDQRTRKSSLDLDELLPQKFLISFTQTARGDIKASDALEQALAKIRQETTEALKILKETSLDRAKERALLNRISPGQAARLLLNAWIDSQPNNTSLLDLDKALEEITSTSLSMFQKIFDIPEANNADNFGSEASNENPLLLS